MTRRSPGGNPGLKSMSTADDSQSISAVSDQSHDQQALWDVPRARNHINTTDGTLVADPATSRAAAESVSLESVTRLQRAILNTLTLARRPCTDEEICERLSWMSAAESGIRSRRAELLRKGLIEVADEAGTTKHGRPCRRYRVRAQRGVA
jgi:hypothetical protein